MRLVDPGLAATGVQGSDTNGGGITAPGLRPRKP